MKKTRVSLDAIDYWQTKWGKMLQDPNSRLDHTKAGKLWIRRFRLPMDVFSMIAEKCHTLNIFRIKDHSKVKVHVPTAEMLPLTCNAYLKHMGFHNSTLFLVPNTQKLVLIFKIFEFQ